MEEILPGIFKFTLEEREGAANTIDLYLVKGTPRSLLIDAAYTSQWCLNRLLTILEQLQVPVNQLDVFLTHKHADHCGLAHALEQRGAAIYMNREEDRHRYDCLYYRSDRANEDAQLQVLTRNGITPESAPLFWNKFMDVNRHLSEPHAIWTMVLEDFDYYDVLPGQLFAYGDYRFRAVLLRGHTYGQTGLEEPEKKILFAADQVLNKTVPIVGTSYPDEHLLEYFIDSVSTLAERYGDYTILPAHEGPVTDLAATAERVVNGYRKKVSQTLNCVRFDHGQTVWEIAKQVYGLTPDKRSDAYFYHSKLITTKTYSMLEYLYDWGKIRREERDGTFYWIR